MKGKIKIVAKGAEVVLGLIFLIGAFNGLVYILGLEAPIPVNPESEFALILTKTRYIFLLQKIVELAVAILLLLGKMRLVALIALAPIVLCIVLYHLFDDVNLPILFSLPMLYVMALSGHWRSLLLLSKLH